MRATGLISHPGLNIEMDFWSSSVQAATSSGGRYAPLVRQSSRDRCVVALGFQSSYESELDPLNPNILLTISVLAATLFLIANVICEV